jgi:two-component system, chemotaxis family, chemotaxis protein CheY
VSNKSLVVDDNFYNRDVARLALENAGYTVEEAENGIEALQKLSHATSDLLILDLEMPELDGIGVLNEIRKVPHHNQMKVIIVTAHPEMTGDITADEVDYVMYKPIDIQIFRVFLQRLRPVDIRAG